MSEENKEYMKNALDHVDIKIAVGINDHTKDKLMDEAMCWAFYQIMVEKLAKKRDQGRGGWWNPDECSIDYLKQLLVEHIEKGDMVDVANFAAMIYARQSMEHKNR